MGSQEKFLIAPMLIEPMLIGVAGGVLLAGEMNGSGFGGAQAALSVDSAELNRHPRGPLPKTKPASWITEYPSGALQAELQGRLVTRLEVDAFGEVSTCEVVGSSGVKAFDRRSCAALVNNARFYPALDEDQQPVKSDYVQTVRYVIPE